MLDYESRDHARRETEEKRARVGSFLYALIVAIVFALFLFYGMIRFILLGFY